MSHTTLAQGAGRAGLELQPAARVAEGIAGLKALVTLHLRQKQLRALPEGIAGLKAYVQ
jgi:hypothetical protein